MAEPPTYRLTLLDPVVTSLKHNFVIFRPQTDSLEEKNNERNRAESHKLSGCIGEKDPEEKQEQLQPPLKKSSPASQQASVES